MGCGSGGTADPTPSTNSISKTSANTEANPIPSPTLTQSTKGISYDNVTIESGTVRYTIREQLARLSTPSYAIGETQKIDGTITFDDTGAIHNGFRILINVQSLVSDESRRDKYLRSNVLQSDAFPTAEFSATGTAGLGWPLPTNGSANFRLMGNQPSEMFQGR
jgi:hypothetical protein